MNAEIEPIYWDNALCLRHKLLYLISQEPLSAAEADGKITGIEILDASNKMNIDTILSYTLELDQGVLGRKTA